MQAVIITSLIDFEKLESQWADISGETSVFSEYVWLKSQWESGCLDVRLICIFDGEALIGALPLQVVEYRFLWKRIKVLTALNNKYSDYVDVIISGGVSRVKVIAKISKSISQLYNEVDFVKIDNLSSGERNCRLLLRHLKDMQGYKLYYQNVTTPRLKFDNFSEIPNKQAKDVERRLKKLKKNHVIKFNHQDGVKGLGGQWFKLVEFHKNKFPNIGFNTPKQQSFYRKLFENGFEQFVEFSYMEIDGKVVACHFGFKKNSKVYYYIPSFDKEYQKHSVGMMLLFSIVEHYKSLGFNEFDMLRGAEAYKRYFLTDEYLNMSFCATNKGLLKRVLLLCFSLFKNRPFKNEA
ncbi:GNAT family N-acetyltransferase [Psychrosphaera haliotis]|uniref:GNAT family N-acetyltransferase n=1 Tax=Psychrosphaera haliotis TaxID=555083 RepID=UPI00237595CE|nr:GNAT family N-acetyltransferase [Psychrosphaera haliotis]